MPSSLSKAKACLCQTDIGSSGWWDEDFISVKDMEGDLWQMWATWSGRAVLIQPLLWPRLDPSCAWSPETCVEARRYFGHCSEGARGECRGWLLMLVEVVHVCRSSDLFSELASRRGPFADVGSFERREVASFTDTSVAAKLNSSVTRRPLLMQDLPKGGSSSSATLPLSLLADRKIWTQRPTWSRAHWRKVRCPGRSGCASIRALGINLHDVGLGAREDLQPACPEGCSCSDWMSRLRLQARAVLSGESRKG